MGHVVRNVADLVEAPSPVRRQLTVWNRDEVNKFLTHAKENNPRFYPVYILAIYGGFREGEVLGINRTDVNLLKGIVTLNHVVQYLMGIGVVITEPKTNKSRRSVKLPLTALNVLRIYLEGKESNQLRVRILPASPRNDMVLRGHVVLILGSQWIVQSNNRMFDR